MDSIKEKRIRKAVDNRIKEFADNLIKRYQKELNEPNGVINSKKKNIFINSLGNEFIFNSAFCRSFDSSFGNVLENLSNDIADITFEVITEDISSYLLPQQTQHIDYIMSDYEKHAKQPEISDYSNFDAFIPKNIQSYTKSHVTDNHFYNPTTKEHYVIELKAGGDLDNKKAKSEKIELLKEYFILKNELVGTDQIVRIFFATAYNKDGEENEWKQERVKQFFAADELLIGKNYWNFVCDDNNGFDIIYDQYKISSQYILSAIEVIKQMYFKGEL